MGKISLLYIFLNILLCNWFIVKYLQEILLSKIETISFRMKEKLHNK